MVLEVWFLGTSASIPTLNRGLPCIALKRRGELILFDCGEGAQRQMMKAGVGFSKKMKVFITHLHGDHVLGLAGLLQSMGLMGREEELQVYGPEGLGRLIEAFEEALGFKLPYEVVVNEVGEGVIHRGDGYFIQAAYVEHSVPTLAYALIEDNRPGRFKPEKAEKLGVPRGPLWKALQRGESVEVKGRIVKPEEVTGPPRKGLKVVYSGDTSFCEAMVKLSEDADLLIHEATFDDSLIQKALEEKHSTASQAAEVAKLAQVKRLVLTHISPRYQDPSPLLDQASKIFPTVLIAEDFLKLRLSYED
ncbi:MAG: ribonuclease Z [Thermoprotei archaeon]|nr:MAG: ribonuclease Z [Thermoprotei archaeon]